MYRVALTLTAGAMLAFFLPTATPAEAAVQAPKVETGVERQITEVQARNNRNRRNVRRARRARPVPACSPGNREAYKFIENKAEFEPADLTKLRNLIQRAGKDCTWQARVFAGDQARGYYTGGRVNYLVDRRTATLVNLFEELGVPKSRMIVQRGGNTSRENLQGTALVIPLNKAGRICDSSKVPAAVRSSKIRFEHGEVELTQRHREQLAAIGAAAASSNCIIRVVTSAGANTAGFRTERFKAATEAARDRFFAARDVLEKAGVDRQQIIVDKIDVRNARRGWRGVDAMTFSIGD